MHRQGRETLKKARNGADELQTEALRKNASQIILSKTLQLSIECRTLQLNTIMPANGYLGTDSSEFRSKHEIMTWFL